MRPDRACCRPTARSRSPRSKPGLLLGAGRVLAGDVEVVDIGLDTSPRHVPAWSRPRTSPRWWRPRPPTAHKWRGAVRVVAGSPGMTGRRPPRLRRPRSAPGSGMVVALEPRRSTATAPPRGRAQRELPAFDWSAAGARRPPPVPRARDRPGLGRERRTPSPPSGATVEAAAGAARDRRRRPVRAGLEQRGRRTRSCVGGRCRPCSPRTTASTVCSPASDPVPTASRRRADWPPTPVRGAAQGPDHGRRRPGRRRARRRLRRPPARHGRHRRRARRHHRRPARDRAWTPFDAASAGRVDPRRRRPRSARRRPRRQRPRGARSRRCSSRARREPR